MSRERAYRMETTVLSDGWRVGILPGLAALPGFRHAVSTRVGPRGASLAWDDPHGLSNRLSLAAAMGAERVAVLRQVHGATVVQAEQALAGEVEGDALMTASPGVAILGLSADCPIVLAADPATGAVGMAHASWRGTVQGVAAELIRRMHQAYGCRPADMRAGICPSAGPCCYEVGQDTVAAARAAAVSAAAEAPAAGPPAAGSVMSGPAAAKAATAGPAVGESALGGEAERYFPRRDGRTFFDLWLANVEQLTRAGLPRHNVELAGVCTICDRRFFSYRREGQRAGRFGGLIVRI